VAPFYVVLILRPAVPSSSSHEMYHRAYPSIRSVPSSSNILGMTTPSPRLAPLLPPSGLHGLSPKSSGLLLNQHLNAALPETVARHPTICGMPLKYVS
jgi:UDP-sugar transporter A1/2/3